jgi:uncharacterized membrane protein YesL
MANEPITKKLDEIVNEAAQELQEDVNLIKDFWKTYKREGAKGLARSIPDLWEQRKHDKSLVKEINKANENFFKRPEFVLIFIFMLFNFCYLSVTSEFASAHLNAPIAVVLSVYTLVSTYERIRIKDIDKDL